MEEKKEILLTQEGYQKLEDELELLKKKYGERAVAQILTKSYLQGKSAIDKVVMILGDRDGRDYRYIASKLKNKINGRK